MTRLTAPVAGIDWLTTSLLKAPLTLVENEISARASNPSPIDETEESKLIREAIETLSSAEQNVIWAASQFYQQRTHQRTPPEDLDEIVEGLGVSRENFRKIKERAKKKIREYMANQNRKPEAKCEDTGDSEFAVSEFWEERQRKVRGT